MYWFSPQMITTAGVEVGQKTKTQLSRVGGRNPIISHRRCLPGLQRQETRQEPEPRHFSVDYGCLNS